MPRARPTFVHSTTRACARSRVLWSAIVAGCVLPGLSACDRGPVAATPARSAEARVVRLAPIVTRDAVRNVTIFGTLFGEEDVLISAKVPGRVSEVHADLGDAVAAGAMLALIDPTDYALAVGEQRAALTAALAKVGLLDLPAETVETAMLPEVARALAEEANARARLDRARLLYERTPPLLSEQDYSDIQTQFQVATTSAAVARLSAEAQIAEARVRESALRTAEQRLADTVVSVPREKPLTFRVAERRVSVGELVTQGQVLYRIIATDRVKFRGGVPERYAGRVMPGVPALVRIDAFAEPVRASVTRVAPAVDAQSRAFEIEIEADNPKGALKPGSFAHASIEIGAEAGVRFIPEDAVVTFAGVSRVYSIKEGKAVEHRVNLAPAEQGLHEVLRDAQGRAGLEEISEVVVSPGNLRAGQAVRVEAGPPN